MTFNLENLQQKTRELGFLSAGIARALPAPSASALDRWLDRGMAAEMTYLTRAPERRKDPRVYWPAARSLIALSVSYAPELPETPRGPDRGIIARYARLGDYHRWLKRRLHALGRFIQSELPGSHYIACVDTSPLLERPLAQMAGLGWIGKNGMLLQRDWGSYTFLGFILLDKDLDPPEPPPADRCGTCRACLDACPTGALVAPHVLDARKCLSYHTIENRGPIPIDARPKMANRVFGCDICQEVCPWTRKTRNPPDHGWVRPRSDLATVELTEAALDSDARFDARWRGTPVKRARRAGMARNMAVALGNSPDRDRAVPALSSMLDDPHPIVRSHAAWALGRHGGPRARQRLEQGLRREVNLEVQWEISRALDVA